MNYLIFCPSPTLSPMNINVLINLVSFLLELCVVFLDLLNDAVCLFVCFLGVTTHCGCIFTDQKRALASSFSRFLDHTQRRAIVGRTPLDEWSIHRGDLYLTAQNTHNRQTSMPPGGIRTHNLSRRAVVDLRLRPRGHWGRQWPASAGIYTRQTVDN